ncbi:hypothetical protein SAMD00019534_122410 [Acytostelium subglobosum LB1]|uniref:hypothetical protein n=1 Tax=Acytostelium subglobosum LB1 TaxID=1410327 RepID=UPI000644F1DE|nr:hypothetical protein SAMD00019534_122410 [Acytostelium subglobosum LB1]GAM29065.1 hypothetical protein SAMD00019534_122410 [Acytostelium subglobosum LB1]|eukprot:XP_012748071.1 hypothetical protein SAMD00019534_122410 [Acytostelium subglobosum LB1]
MLYFPYCFPDGINMLTLLAYDLNSTLASSFEMNYQIDNFPSGALDVASQIYYLAFVAPGQTSQLTIVALQLQTFDQTHYTIDIGEEVLKTDMLQLYGHGSNLFLAKYPNGTMGEIFVSSINLEFGQMTKLISIPDRYIPAYTSPFVHSYTYSPFVHDTENNFIVVLDQPSTTELVIHNLDMETLNVTLITVPNNIPTGRNLYYAY